MCVSPLYAPRPGNIDIGRAHDLRPPRPDESNESGADGYSPIEPPLQRRRLLMPMAFGFQPSQKDIL